MNANLELAYVVVAVPEPASLNRFFGDVIGLVPGEPTADAGATWRNDDKVHRVVVERGAENDATHLGLETIDDTTFDLTIDKLRSAGFAVDDGDDRLREARRVRRLARTGAPWGVQVELVTQLAEAPRPFEAPLVPGGFKTSGVGFGHTVFLTTEFDESLRFVTEGLGMVQSDWIETTIAEGIELAVHFFHCNARHHTIALARAPFELPQKLHHVMFEANALDDVGSAFDRVWATDLPIPNGLGKHDNDRMLSFYVESPAGFQVEFGHGARTITDDWDDDRRYDRISSWGHQPLRSA
jgi:2,3-dihydroxybiphenyl 1,2-dioxygenase